MLGQLYRSVAFDARPPAILHNTISDDTPGAHTHTHRHKKENALLGPIGARPSQKQQPTVPNNTIDWTLINSSFVMGDAWTAL